MRCGEHSPVDRLSISIHRAFLLFFFSLLQTLPTTLITNFDCIADLVIHCAVVLLSFSSPF